MKHRLWFKRLFPAIRRLPRGQAGLLPPQAPAVHGSVLLLRAGSVVCLLLALAGLPGATEVAQAGTITVTSPTDTSGGPDCTLRDAITAANTNTKTGGCPAGSPGLDTITFDLGSGAHGLTTINLLSSLPAITEDLTIIGNRSLILSGSGATRLFSVNGGVTLRLQQLFMANANSGAGDGGAISNHGNLWLESSSIKNSQTDSSHNGGAIFSDGPVTVTDSLLESNRAGSGGALFANSGNATVTINNTLFSSNQAITTSTGYGGAIWVGSLAQVSITGGVTDYSSSAINYNAAKYGGAIYLSPGARLTLASIVGPQGVGSCGYGMSCNSATASGGGLYNDGGAAAMTDVTLSGNSAHDDGGGIWNGGTLTVTDAALDDNGSNGSGSGGGIWNGGTFLATDDTLTSNSAPSGDGGGIYNSSALTVTNATLIGNFANRGGGVRNHNGTATLANDTLSYNSTSSGGGFGGGLFQSGAFVTQTMTLLNTIVVTGSIGANCYDDLTTVATITSTGYNLSNDATCVPYFTQPGDLNNGNPNLGPAAYNGGLTVNFMPIPPSPAIDAIPLGVNGCGTTLTHDQRGAPRPINGKCDIGAVEYGWLLWLPLVRR